jgi:hypothetical protein
VSEASKAAYVPPRIEFDKAEDDVWYFTGDLGTWGPFGSLGEAKAAAVAKTHDHMLAALAYSEDHDD